MSSDSPSPTAITDLVRAGYAVEGPALELGVLVDGEAVPDAPVRVPVGMLNRHGLVAGATGTGKTRTLQVMAEQLSALGVPVFAPDIKGDLSGVAVAGQPSEKLVARCAGIGQQWAGAASPVEFMTLGGLGAGLGLRTSVASFGPVMLAKVLGLNETQESSLTLVFHWAERSGRPLVTLADLRAAVQHLTSPEGKADLTELGGLSKATAGVILRELVVFADGGADVFFGTPEVRVTDLIRTAPDGRGIISLLEVPTVQDRPELFSTFLMYLLTRLFAELPEVGDPEKPVMVFFFDEAHLLFRDASKDFLEVIERTVRLIRSKGVGIIFVTQAPQDIPSAVLAQLGSRVQHQLRAHTPDAAKALRETVSTYPTSTYDLEKVLTSLPTGEAIVTVMDPDGAPTPVAWTRLRAPQGSMDPAPPEVVQQIVAASPLAADYAPVAAPPPTPAPAPTTPAPTTAPTAEETAAQWEAEEAGRVAREADEIARSSGSRSRSRSTGRSRSRASSPLEKAAGEAGRTFAREVVKALFRRRR